MFSINGVRQSGGLSPVINQMSLSPVGSLNSAVPFYLTGAFIAGAGGAPDDVTIVPAGGLGFAFKVLAVEAEPTTAVGGSTLTARDTVGGAGAALSSAIASAAATRARSTLNDRPTVAADKGVFLRRSDSGVAGQYQVECVRV